MKKMKRSKNRHYTFIVLCLSFIFVFSVIGNAQVQDETAKRVTKESMLPSVADKKVSFNPIDRNPFLSKEEVLQMEQWNKAKQRKSAEEEADRKRQAEAERKRLLQQKILEEELKRHPARAVMYKIRVDGILGKEAIVNGEVVGVGAKVLGAKVVSITDDAVWFTYKGERFQRKLPLM